MDIKNVWIGILLIFLPVWASGQIIPPGMGEVEAGSWLALGLKQDLGKEDKGWSSSTYLGVGRKSVPDKKNLFEKHAVFVLNQEFIHRFHPHWEYSIAASYRRQDLYKKEAPAVHDDPRFKQEMRLYGKISYLYKVLNFDITPTLRQEVMKYYTPDFKDHSESLRIRSRFRLKVGFPLDVDKIHRISLYSEQLFSISQSGNSAEWGSFNYSDSRFSVYYSWSPMEVPFSIDIGYMYNVVGKGPEYTGNYLGIDFVLKNIF